MSKVSQEQARRSLDDLHPGAASRGLVGREGPFFWLFTYDVATGHPAPPGAPSWVVLDTGECGSVEPRENLETAIERLAGDVR